MCAHLDPDGLYRFLEYPTKKPIYNVFIIAKQAVGDNTKYTADDQFCLGIPHRKPKDPRVTRQRAMKWLIDNAYQNDSSHSLLWAYKFKNSYNNVTTGALKKWPSAFAQAYVIRAFNAAYQETGNSLYKTYAIKAARAFSVSVDEGGFSHPIEANKLFFEEIPVKPYPMILNGHLVATLSLLETAKLYKNLELYQLAQKGLEAAKQLIPKYDIGYWSRYDLNPRKSELFLRLRPELKNPKSLGLPVQSIEIVDAKQVAPPIRLSFDNPKLNDFDGAWRINGTDWSPTQRVDGRLVRLAGDRHLDYAKAGIPSGGSSFNNYFITELPVLRFADNTKIPSFVIKLTYKDTSKGSLSFDIRDIRNGKSLTFVSLGTIPLLGDDKWKTAKYNLSPAYLGWYVGPDYQKYHIKLLKEIYAITGDSTFLAYAKRWQCYLDQQSLYDGNQVVRFAHQCK